MESKLGDISDVLWIVYYHVVPGNVHVFFSVNVETELTKLTKLTLKTQKR